MPKTLKLDWRSNLTCYVKAVEPGPDGSAFYVAKVVILDYRYSTGSANRSAIRNAFQDVPPEYGFYYVALRRGSFVTIVVTIGRGRSLEEFEARARNAGYASDLYYVNECDDVQYAAWVEDRRLPILPCPIPEDDPLPKTTKPPPPDPAIVIEDWARRIGNRPDLFVPDVQRAVAAQCVLYLMTHRSRPGDPASDYVELYGKVCDHLGLERRE